MSLIAVFEICHSEINSIASCDEQGSSWYGEKNQLTEIGLKPTQMMLKQIVHSSSF